MQKQQHNNHQFLITKMDYTPYQEIYSRKWHTCNFNRFSA